MVVTERTVRRYIRKFAESDIQTRLELFLVSRGIKGPHLAREASMSRQHVLRVKQGAMDITRGKMAKLVSAARRLTLEPIRPEDLFELVAEEGGNRILAAERAAIMRAAAVYAAELQIAQRRLGAVLEKPVATWRALFERQGQTSVPLVRVLLRNAYWELDRDPSRAHAIYEIVFELAAELPAEITPDLRTTIRGLTYLYRAYACRELGRYADAVAMLDWAEREVEGTPSCSTELAQVWYERAALLFKQGDLAGAERLTRRAATFFTILDDRRRVARVQILHGSIAYERGDIATARSLWLLAIDPLRVAGDDDAVASLTMNVGAAEMLLGNVEEAKAWLDRAHRMFTKLGVRSEVIRVRWTQAKLRLLHEDRLDGLRLLRAVRADYLGARMPAEAGFVGLDIVEALLEDDSPSDELVGLARAVVHAFEEASATPKMLEALAYLREAVQRRRARAELVGEVRAYLHEAVRGTDAPFVPRTPMVTASGSTECLPG